MSGPHVAPVVPPSLRDRVRPVSAAGQRTLPIPDTLDMVFPEGLPRGVTVTTSGDAARSIAFTLTAAAGRAGSWLAVLGVADPGWRAAAELGVATNRIVHIDTSGARGRDADAVAAALDGFDLVLIGARVRLNSNVERRLGARARERGTVLIGVQESATWDGRATPAGPFRGVADLRVTTRGGRWQGLGAGTGRLAGRTVEVTVEGKRLPGRRRRARLWLPGPDGTPALEDPVSFPAGSNSAAPAHRIGRSA